MNLIRKIHKWAAVLVGIQLLLWLISGLYFNVMDHKKAAGRTHFNSSQSTVSYDKGRLVDVKAVLKNVKPATSLKLITLLSRPYYLITHQKGLYKHFKNTYTLIDAIAGKKIIMNDDFAARLAKHSYSGSEGVLSTQLLLPPIKDFPKEQNRLWRVNFANNINTSVYIEAGSGRLVGHSDDEKRLADFFFMLHFMDYGSTGSFNNVQIMLFGFIALWLSLTGAVWTVQLVKRGKYSV